MKATNKSNIFTEFKMKRVPIPEKYQVKQHDHDRYVWQSQNGRIFRVTEMEDNHLVNTYKMMVNTILFAKEQSKHRMISSTMRKMVTAVSYHLHYIGYELWFRIYPPVLQDPKYKMVEQ